MINAWKLGHKLWEPIKYDTEHTWEWRECQQASQPASSNKEKETSLLVPEESKEGKQVFHCEPQASTLPSVDVTNDMFNIHKVKKVTTAFPI